MQNRNNRALIIPSFLLLISVSACEDSGAFLPEITNDEHTLTIDTTSIAPLKSAQFSNSEILFRLGNIIFCQTNFSGQITLESDLIEDLGADNYDIAEIKCVVEYYFNIEIASTETLHKVKDWVLCVENELEKAQASTKKASLHTSNIFIPNAIVNPSLNITFTCNIYTFNKTGKIEKATDFKARAENYTEEILSASGNLIQTIKTSYKFSSGVAENPYGENIKVTWTGTVTTEITANGSTVKYTQTLLHSAIIDEKFNITVLNSTFENEKSSGSITPGGTDLDRNTYSIITEIIASHLDIELTPIFLTASFAEDLNVSSLDMFEILSEIEDQFNFEIPVDVAETILTVQDLYNYTKEHRK